WAVGAVSLLVTVVNPYLAAGALFPFRLFSYIDASTPAFQAIGELRPPFSGYVPTVALRAYQGLFFFSIAAAVLAAAFTAFAARRPAGLRRGERRHVPVPLRPEAGTRPTPDSSQEAADRFDIAGLAIFCGAAYLSLLARRNMTLFALAGAPF